MIIYTQTCKEKAIFCNHLCCTHTLDPNIFQTNSWTTNLFDILKCPNSQGCCVQEAVPAGVRCPHLLMVADEDEVLAFLAQRGDGVSLENFCSLLYDHQTGLQLLQDFPVFGCSCGRHPNDLLGTMWVKFYGHIDWADTKGFPHCWRDGAPWGPWRPTGSPSLSEAETGSRCFWLLPIGPRRSGSPPDPLPPRMQPRPCSARPTSCTQSVN